MKKFNVFVLFFVSALLLILNGCFSPYGADETNITISLGDLGRVAVSSAEINTLSYEVILDGPGGRRTETFSGTSTSIRVRPGTYNVIVRATGNNPGGAYSTDFPSRMLRGWGCERVTIQRGQDNPISIKMATATEVTSARQLNTALSQNLGIREHIIVIKDSITDLPGSSDYSVFGRVTLVAENESTINLSSARFTISLGEPSDGLTLGKEGMGGTLILDGDNNPFTYPLIDISGGNLIMNDGITLRSRNRTGSGNGGGVELNGSVASFTMNGGTISRNTVPSDGGGVYVNSGNFTMKGGTISRNEADWGGGGVAVDGGTFTMEGGEIINNIAGIDGGGVSVWANGSSFEMTGGTIAGNTAEQNGGGVIFTRAPVGPSNSFYKGPNAIITGSDGPNGNSVKQGNDQGHAVFFGPLDFGRPYIDISVGRGTTLTATGPTDVYTSIPSGLWKP